jgi:hypothetical protein
MTGSGPGELIRLAIKQIAGLIIPLMAILRALAVPKYVDAFDPLFAAVSAAPRVPPRDFARKIIKIASRGRLPLLTVPKFCRTAYVALSSAHLVHRNRAGNANGFKRNSSGLHE